MGQFKFLRYLLNRRIDKGSITYWTYSCRNKIWGQTQTNGQSETGETRAYQPDATAPLDIVGTG